jgi:hypothetical protein
MQVLKGATEKKCAATTAYLQNISRIRIVCLIRSCSAIFHTHVYRHEFTIYCNKIWAVLPIFKTDQLKR